MREMRDPQNGCQIGQVPLYVYTFCKTPSIREIPDHATFREMEHTLDWLDKLWGFSLWPCVIWPTLTTCILQSIYITILLEHKNNLSLYDSLKVACVLYILKVNLKIKSCH